MAEGNQDHQRASLKEKRVAEMYNDINGYAAMMAMLIVTVVPCLTG